ncbi:MAG: hypothetical protein JW816_02920 [Candidatus Buchananbacteria bacterium]|nr:hypothetical protein [Candidatus Buchananbacteria bacterium]
MPTKKLGEIIDWYDCKKLRTVTMILYSKGFRSNKEMPDKEGSKKGECLHFMQMGNGLVVAILYNKTTNRVISVRLDDENGVAITPEDLKMPWFLALSTAA